MVGSGSKVWFRRFGLVGLDGRFRLVGFVWSLWLNRFGLVGLDWLQHGC